MSAAPPKSSLAEVLIVPPNRLLTKNLAGAGKTYSRVVAVVMHLLKPILGGKTPRKFWLTEHKMVCSHSCTAITNAMQDD